MVLRKNFFVQIHVKPNLVLSHFGWVVLRKTIDLYICRAKSGFNLWGGGGSISRHK